MKPTDKTEPVVRMTDAGLAVEILKNCAAHYAKPEWYAVTLSMPGQEQVFIDRAINLATRLIAEARQGDAQRNLAIIHKANPDDKYETVQEGIEAIISERNQALKNDEAGEARRIAELAGERNRQYEFNAGQIAKLAAAEVERDRLAATLGQVRETLLAHEWVEVSYTDRPPIRFCLGCSAIADGFYNETPLPNHEPDCWLAATLNTLSPVPPPTPTVGKLD